MENFNYGEVSTNHELLARLIHRINRYNPKNPGIKNLPCRFFLDGRWRNGIIYEDDWRVFITGQGVAGYEVTSRRNKYTGVIEGLDQLKVEFVVPEIYKNECDLILMELTEEEVIINDYREIVGDDKVYDWLILNFYKDNRTPEDLKIIWEDLQSIRIQARNVSFGKIINKYRTLNYNHAKVHELLEFALKLAV
jgi:hypothetical protein